MQNASDRRKRGDRRKRLRLTPRFWLITALAIFAYIAASYASGFVEIWRLRVEIHQVKEEIVEAEARNEQLRKELHYLQSDEYIEKVAREELGLVKPGETPVILTSPSEAEQFQEAGGTPGPLEAGSTGP